MKKTKFKVWNKKLKIFTTDFCIDANGDLHYIGDNSNVNQEDLIVLQYSGIEDIEGKEIYEGDIIEYKYNSIKKLWWRDPEHKKEIDEYVEREKKNLFANRNVVEYDKCQFILGYPNLLLDYNFPNEIEIIESRNVCDIIYIYKDFKVIGNVYENKDLI